MLDEVTTGVDPVSRMELWRIISGAAANGTAVIAATTYLDEAERAGWVDLLHDGRQLASGTPQEIVDGIPGTVSDEAAAGPGPPPATGAAGTSGTSTATRPAGDAPEGGAYRPSLRTPRSRNCWPTGARHERT